MCDVQRTYTLSGHHMLQIIYCLFLHSLCASALCFSLLRSCRLPQVGPIGLPDARVCATAPLQPLVTCDILVCIDKLITSTFTYLPYLPYFYVLVGLCWVYRHL